VALAIVPVLSVLSAQSLARDPRISGAPVGHLQGARPMTFAISSPNFSNGGWATRSGAQLIFLDLTHEDYRQVLPFSR